MAQVAKRADAFADRPNESLLLVRAVWSTTPGYLAAHPVIPPRPETPINDPAALGYSAKTTAVRAVLRTI